MSLNIAFAGDRNISVRILSFLLKEGITPKVLIVSDSENASHSGELVELCSDYSDVQILRGDSFKSPSGIRILQEKMIDYIISIHFPSIYPETVLSIPKIGVLNLHPAYLPYNRGWHTPTWAIIDGTPYGATLHFIEKDIDSGEILYQENIDVLPDDTADSLYQRVLELEYEVFVKAWPQIKKCNFNSYKQDLSKGTIHKKMDIENIRHIELYQNFKAIDLINIIRGLTTNKIEESVFFIDSKGQKYHIQCTITKEKDTQ